MTETMEPPVYGSVDEIAPQAIEETTPEEPVKKRRGRPPGSTNRTTGTRARRGKKSLEQDIGGMLVMFNFLFGFMPQPWKDDQFSEQEIIALSKALDAYAQDHATVYRYLSSVLIGGGTSTIQLLLVVGGITQRRLENHNVDLAKVLGFSSDGVANGESQSVATA